jgi:hypothetical protein
MPVEDVTCVAQWEVILPTTYTITFDANGGLGGGDQTVEEGVMPMIPTVTREGYNFNSWDAEIVAATDDKTYIAIWTPVVNYTITFDANGGVGGEVQTLEKGDMPTVPTVTREGYTFVSWTPEVVEVVTNATYTANWDMDTVNYTITFDANGGEGGEEQTVEEGIMPTPPLVNYKGFNFIEWTPVIVEAAADVTYTAQWVAEVNYIITFDADGGEGGVIRTIAENTMPVAPTVTRDGYDFTGWNPAVIVIATENATYTAQWEMIANPTSTITFDLNGGDSAAIDPIIADEGSSDYAHPEDPTREGYTFLGWSPAVPATMPVDDVTCVAQWEEIVATTYTITFDANGGEGGEVQEVEEGAMPEVPTVTNANLTFLGWTPEVEAATGDTTYTALWLADVNGDGEISPLDALMALQGGTGELALTPEQFDAADVNNDGRVSSIDALMILHFASGRLTAFPSAAV